MSAQPERSVEGNILSSTDKPTIRVKIDDDFVYLGRLQFVLYSVAEVELFVFVRADTQKKLAGLLIVQFEGYLESNNHVYDYTVRDLVTLGGHEFILDTFVYTIAQDMENPESDSARTLSFVKQNGYMLPEQAISCRFVRLLDEKRREILFSYMTDLGQFGVNAGEVSRDFRLLPECESMAGRQLAAALSVFEVIEG